MKTEPGKIMVRLKKLEGGVRYFPINASEFDESIHEKMPGQAQASDPPPRELRISPPPVAAAAPAPPAPPAAKAEPIAEKPAAVHSKPKAKPKLVEKRSHGKKTRAA